MNPSSASRRRSRARTCVVTWRIHTVVAALVAPAAALAQDPAQSQTAELTTPPRPTPTVVTAYTPDATRAQLTTRRDSLVQTGKQGDEVRAIGQRLTDGDFRPGDRFLVQDLLLARQGATGSGDTVIVREGVSGPVFSLNTWADAPLKGVLRAELPATVERYERTYVREPRIRVVPLTRLSITGGVPRPGFYVVDPDRQLTDALTLAGGPGAAGQKKGRISVIRGSKQIYDTKAVQTAIRDGRTLDDLNIRSGDEIRVEEPKRSSFPSASTIFFGISAITGLLVLIRSLYQTS